MTHFVLILFTIYKKLLWLTIDEHVQYEDKTDFRLSGGCNLAVFWGISACLYPTFRYRLPIVP